MRKTSVLVLMSACLALLMLVSPAAADGPPPLAEIVKGNPNVANMQERIDFWVNGIRDAKDDATLTKASKGLAADYAAFDQKEAGYVFAEKASAKLLALIGKMNKDPMIRAKEVNIALVVSQMPQVTSQAALDALIVLPGNPGARYIAWKGYAEARTRIFAYGKNSADKTLASVDKAVKFEVSQDKPSYQVMKQMFRMLTLEETRPGAVMEDVWANAQKQSFSVLQKNWRAWCLRVRNGEMEMADAARVAVSSLPVHSAWIGQDKARAELLQMLVDMAWAAGNAYVDARKASTPADSMSSLLKDIEAALNKVTQSTRTFIERPLNDPKSSPDMVIWWVNEGNYGVQAWVDELKPKGVVQPKIEKPTSAPAPAAEPAAAVEPAKEEPAK